MPEKEDRVQAKPHKESISPLPRRFSAVDLYAAWLAAFGPDLPRQRRPGNRSGATP